jgi:hypothetical protein
LNPEAGNRQLPTIFFLSYDPSLKYRMTLRTIYHIRTGNQGGIAEIAKNPAEIMCGWDTRAFWHETTFDNQVSIIFGVPSPGDNS